MRLALLVSCAPFVLGSLVGSVRGFAVRAAFLGPWVPLCPLLVLCVVVPCGLAFLFLLGSFWGRPYFAPKETLGSCFPGEPRGPSALSLFELGMDD